MNNKEAVRISIVLPKSLYEGIVKNPDNICNGVIYDAIRAGDVITDGPVQNNWIPCSERPPEKDGRYQVTRYDDVTNTEFIDILWFEKNIWWNRHATGDYAVTAWMPLPKPYAALWHPSG